MCVCWRGIVWSIQVQIRFEEGSPAELYEPHDRETDMFSAAPLKGVSTPTHSSASARVCVCCKCEDARLRANEFRRRTDGASYAGYGFPRWNGSEMRLNSLGEA